MLSPDRSGAWCYIDSATGEATWNEPAKSGPPRDGSFAPLPAPFAQDPPLLSPSLTLESPDLQRLAHWLAIFEDCDHRVLLMCLTTGAIREGPWICLRTAHGIVYFANLISRATRWFPPHMWMQGWIERAVMSSRGIMNSYGHAGQPFLRNVLSIPAGRLRTDGGAPYLYDDSHGMPQYPNDADDTTRTYP